jgi:hypothetical protein
MHSPIAFTGALYLRTHCPHGSSGSEHVFAFQQAGNLAFPYRKRTQHKRAMRNGFISRNLKRAT